MRTQSICLALTIVLLCPYASAQWVQTNKLLLLKRLSVFHRVVNTRFNSDCGNSEPKSQ